MRPVRSHMAPNCKSIASSTALHVNCTLCSTIQGPFWKVPLLNVLVFGMNLDSIMNDVGMVIASGVLRGVPETVSSACSSIAAMFSTENPSVKPQPVDSYVNNSE